MFFRPQPVQGGIALFGAGEMAACVKRILCHPVFHPEGEKVVPLLHDDLHKPFALLRQFQAGFQGVVELVGEHGAEIPPRRSAEVP